MDPQAQTRLHPTGHRRSAKKPIRSSPCPRHLSMDLKPAPLPPYYHTMFRILATENRSKQMKTLIAEVMDRACLKPSFKFFVVGGESREKKNWIVVRREKNFRYDTFDVASGQEKEGFSGRNLWR
ncbi:hypothetical protein AMTR_s00147p00069920 [Amborella trichopoda]|uniref:Uncharacterized protein n=1 Tax=Amborella trichopoda TaxID=13333 RepID=W1PBF7_AMBTC|nr:hypothetical protein AMTR_s00147p00069920 [Amborella trichopoda]